MPQVLRLEKFSAFSFDGRYLETELMTRLGPFELDQIHQGDALVCLKQLPDDCIQCVVTSPPYWNLRDYNVDGQLGLEPTPEEHVAAIVEIFHEVKRVLRPDGTLWLNYGDCYNSRQATNGVSFRHDRAELIKSKRIPRGKGRYGGGNNSCPGLKPKDLVGMPWRIAFALQADGWYLRSDIIWAKNNPMPESVIDRPTKAHEYLFLLTKSPQYFYDNNAIREPQTGNAHSRGKGITPKSAKSDSGIKANTSFQSATSGKVKIEGGRNKRTVWTIPTQPSKSVRVGDYVGPDGKLYKVSPDCPIHGPSALNRMKQKAGCDEPINLYENDNVDKSNCHDLKPQDESASRHSLEKSQTSKSNDPEHKNESIHDRKIFGPFHKDEPQKHRHTQDKQEKLSSSLGSDDQNNALSAIFHNNQIHKRDHDASTNSSCKPCAENSCHIDNKSKKQESSVQHDCKHESNTLQDAKDAHSPDQKQSCSVGKSSLHNNSISGCTCQEGFVAHFATFPQALVEPCILAGTSARGACPECGKPWKRIVSKEFRQTGPDRDNVTGQDNMQGWEGMPRGNTDSITTGWKPICSHYPRVDEWQKIPARNIDESQLDYESKIASIIKIRHELLKYWKDHETVPCIVLDPFIGSGTTGLVAIKYDRSFIGFDLSAEYCGTLSIPRLQAARSSLSPKESAAGQLPLFPQEGDSK